jgi:uncharacterized membrane protein YsdA (DUF1294 family)
VTDSGEGSPRRRRRPLAGPTTIFVIVFVLGVLALTFFAKWHALLAWLVCVNVVTFAMYAYDKYAAPREWWRISELSLHTFALLGGSPSALLAQQVLRHKTAKPLFLVIFWLILVAQVALLGWQLIK